MSTVDTLVVGYEVAPFDAPLREPFTIAIGRLDTVRNVLVAVTLANGVIGYGEGAPLPPISGETQATVLAACQELRALVMGSDATAWRQTAARMRELLHAQACARTAVEMALVDAVAKSRREPLWRLFGDRAEPVLTDLSIPIVEPAHGARLASDAVAAGFTVLKIKVGSGHDADLARIQAIQYAAPSCRLTIDANQGYTADGAIRLARAITDRRLPVDLFEQPVLRHDRNGLRQVRRGCTIPVAADESAWSAADVADLAEREAIDVVNLKLMKTGLAEGLALFDQARRSGIGLMMGGMIETRLAMGCAAHLVASQGDVRFVDLDTPLLLAHDPCTGGHVMRRNAFDLSPVVAGIGCWPTGRAPGFLP